MSDHEGVLVKAMVAQLKADAGVRAVLGDPARVWDQPPDRPVFPHLLIGRVESRPVAADECGIEHVLTLTCVSKYPGSEEARAVVAAVRAGLLDVVLEADGMRTVSVRVVFSDVFRSPDMKRAWAVVRVRAVTEDV